MTGNEAIDYLTEDTASDMTITDQQLSVITVALDRGYYPDLWELLAYDTATLRKVDGLGAPIPEYEGSLNDDLSIVASNAIDYLNDMGITPRAYDHGETDPTAGYGNSTARDGAARGGGGEGVAA
jgi:hypothetical protein